MGAESELEAIFLSFLDVTLRDSALNLAWGSPGLFFEELKGEGGGELGGEREGEENRERDGEGPRVFEEGGGKGGGGESEQFNSSSSQSSSPSSSYTEDRSLKPVPLFALLIGPPSFSSSCTFCTFPAGGEEIFL